MSYRQREDWKTSGHNLIRHGKNLDEKVKGAEMVIEGWFNRELEYALADGSWRLMPSYGKYVGSLLPELPKCRFDPKIIDALSNKYKKSGKSGGLAQL